MVRSLNAGRPGASPEVPAPPPPPPAAGGVTFVMRAAKRR
jgi:hypothetical protein